MKSGFDDTTTAGPARKAVTRGRKTLRSYMSDGKAILSAESGLEADALIVLLADPKVRSLRTQPYFVKYFEADVQHTHYPDILATTSSESLVIEVKPDKYCLTPEIQHRTATMIEIFALRNEKYCLWPESNIRMQPRLDNSKLLFHYRKGWVDRSVTLRVIAILQSQGPKPLDALIYLIPGLTLGQAYVLIAQGCVHFDTQVPLSPLSLVAAYPF